MNVYDFDQTIYDGDSTVDFYLFCLRRRPAIITCVWGQGLGVFLRVMKKIDTTAMKERFFSFLAKLADTETLVREFWVGRQNKIKPWYLQRREKTDVIISASPEFLLEPICKLLGAAPPIATRVDVNTGKIEGKNCKGEEKKRRFCETYPDEKIDCFFSDSKTDYPLAQLAKTSFLVKGNDLLPWSGVSERG